MAARGAADEMDLALPIALGSLIAAGVAGWFGFGGGPVLWLGLIVAAWMATPPVLTGKKDHAGRPTPAHDGEQSKMGAYRRWAAMRTSLFVPGGDWLPGKKVRASWVAGVVLGVGAVAVPLHPDISVWGDGVVAPLADWGGWINGAAVAISVWALMGAIRRNAAPADESPGVNLAALVAAAKAKTSARVLAVVAVQAGAAAGYAAWHFAGLVDWGTYPQEVARVVLGAAAGVLIAGAAVLPVWWGASLGTWRELVATRAQWDPRWVAAGVKEPNPHLVSHEMVGSLTVDTFDAPAHLGSAWFCSAGVAQKISVPLGANMRVWTVSSPNTDSQNQPVPGSAHPSRFRVVHVAADQMPDITDPDADPEMVTVLLEAAMGAACDAGGVSRYLLSSADRVSDHSGAPAQPPATDPVEADEHDGVAEDDEEDVSGPQPDEPGASRWSVWASTWVNPDGLGGSHLRSHVKDQLATQLGVPVLVDPRAQNRQGVVFAGPAAHDEVTYADGSALSVEAMVDLEREDAWRARWAAVLKQEVNAPRPELALFDTQTVAGAQVMRQPFVTLEGEDPGQYFGLEAKLKATLQGAPYVAVTGFPGPGKRPGDRHSQAFCVYWATSPVPEGPHALPASRGEGPRWVLAGRFNEAFKAARLAAPEVAGATALTRPNSRGHIWRVDLRLWGGVTLSDVRGAAHRIRGALGSPWLRVAAAPDGCTIYAGVEPAQARLANPEADEQLLAALDWEQAWLDSKVSGVGGQLPSLTSAQPAPGNEQVQLLDFTLPPGVSREDVTKALGKLRTATSNSFLQVRAGADASSIRILACRTDPMPDLAPIRWEQIDEAQVAIPFATGVEGETLAWDVGEDPHLLIVGTTGSGKSSAVQVLLFGMLAHGWSVHVADPVKGGADFKFAAPWLSSMSTTIAQTSAMMDAVYAEVTRRKDLNSKHGVGSYTELPQDVRPEHMVVFMDEFTSLIIADKPTKPITDDPTEAHEYEEAMARVAQITGIGSKAGRIVREARSAGVSLILAGQELKAKTLDSVPGGEVLRTQMSGLVLGKMSSGSLQAALKRPEDAPDLGDVVPRGRGVLETSGAATAIVQSWYEHPIQQVLADQLGERREPLGEADRLVLPDPSTDSNSGQERGEPQVVDLGESELSLADLEGFLNEGDPPAYQTAQNSEDDLDDEPVGEWPQFATPAGREPDPEPAPAVAHDLEPPEHPAGEWPGLEPLAAPATAAVPEPRPAETRVGETVVVHTGVGDPPEVGGLPVLVARETGGRGELALAPSDDDEDHGWWPIGALARWLSACPQVRTVVWDDPALGELDELGTPRLEVARDVLAAAGVELQHSPEPSPLEPDPPATAETAEDPGRSTTHARVPAEVPEGATVVDGRVYVDHW